MASMTAQILVGQPDMYHGGIYPTHVVSLYENSRPGWRLQPTGRDLGGSPVDNTGEGRILSIREVVWVPSGPEHILEDALLLVAIHVLWGADRAAPAVDDLGVPELLDEDFVDLTKIPTEALQELRGFVAAIDVDYKLVIAILEGSSVLAQLPVLERYPMQVEVCTVSYSRLRREMANSGPLVACGSLEPPPGADHRYYGLNIN